MSEQKNQLEEIVKGNVFASDDSYKRAIEIAKTISSSDLVPQAYRNKSANCLIALDIARQVKSSPLIVMQNLHIIQGKPSWSSTYIAAAVRTKFKYLKVLTTGEGMERGCQVIAYDDKGGVIAEGVRVTMQMAKAEGWIDKNGSKWKTMPDLMLQYRANAFFGRIYCPEVLIGLQSEFEIYDVKGQVIDIETVEDPFNKGKETPKKEIADAGPETPKEEPAPEVQAKTQDDLIIVVQSKIENHLKAMGKQPSLIYKYAVDVFPGKKLTDLTLDEMNTLKDKIVNGKIG